MHARRAKYGLVDTDRGDTLLLHLGMSRGVCGSILWRSASTTMSCLRWPTAGRWRFNDARRFGSLDLVATVDLDKHPLLAGLGPEPLGAGVRRGVSGGSVRGTCGTGQGAAARSKADRGVGNIYVCEALNCARIHPARAGATVSAAKIAALADAIPRVLQGPPSAPEDRACAITPPPMAHSAISRSRSASMAARASRCPRDGHTIQRIVQSGRSSFFCGWCQR